MNQTPNQIDAKLGEKPEPKTAFPFLDEQRAKMQAHAIEKPILATDEIAAALDSGDYDHLEKYTERSFILLTVVVVPTADESDVQWYASARFVNAAGRVKSGVFWTNKENGRARAVVNYLLENVGHGAIKADRRHNAMHAYRPAHALEFE